MGNVSRGAADERLCHRTRNGRVARPSRNLAATAVRRIATEPEKHPTRGIFYAIWRLVEEREGEGKEA
jgi:hypothetical protein